MDLPSCTQESDAAKNLLPLCATRWAVRIHSLKRFRQNYGSVPLTLEEIVNGNASNKRKSALQGYIKRLQKMDTMYCKVRNSVQQVLIRQTLLKIRSETGFSKTNEEGELPKKLNLKEPVEKRIVTVPCKLENSLNPSSSVSFTPKEKLWKEFYGIVDHFLNELKRRFDQARMKKVIKLENVILFSIRQGSLSPEELQLEKLKNESAMGQTLLGKKLIMLILTIPASADSSERSFSDFRRLKTYLRANMSQRLNHLLVAQIYGSRLSSLQLHDILKESVSRTSERKSTFCNYEVSK
ncbi:hypothetical protein PR048_001797 [Dryococelus australis]|uniref:HAT C-terminal dimerisation domain-containing protein n=1 Tax=Dryococelus australis TaxID=614101 RepID=A0ABQ9IKU5_9NEOP|nr:hypothetical protein PR048_001797 [Dryococelus australis]